MIKREDIMKAYQFRYACKKFDRSKSLNTEDFNLILETGRLSPSSFGFEPWKFLVIEREELREKLKENAKGAIGALNGASHFLILLARKKIDVEYNSDYLKYIMTEVKNLPLDVQEKLMNVFGDFQKNDFNIVGDERFFFDWSCKQTYIVLGNMLTTAALLGIDSCPVEGFNREKTEQLLELEGVLDRKHFGVSVMVGFGYRDETLDFDKTRQSMKDVVEWVI